MPEKWDPAIYNHDTGTIAHKYIAEIDVEARRWYKCKVCFNHKESDGKFHCRTKL